MEAQIGRFVDDYTDVADGSSAYKDVFTFTFLTSSDVNFGKGKFGTVWR